MMETPLLLFVFSLLACFGGSYGIYQGYLHYKNNIPMRQGGGHLGKTYPLNPKVGGIMLMVGGFTILCIGATFLFVFLNNIQ